MDLDPNLQLKLNLSLRFDLRLNSDLLLISKIANYCTFKKMPLYPFRFFAKTPFRLRNCITEKFINFHANMHLGLMTGDKAQLSP